MRDWSPAGLQATFGDDAIITRIFFYRYAVVPCSVYEVSQCLDPLDEATCSDPLLIFTGRTGDCYPEFGTPGQPNFLDIDALVIKFHGINFWPGPPPRGTTEWNGLQADNLFTSDFRQVSFLDMSVAVDGYKGLPYKEQGPCDPNTATDNCGNPCSTDP